MPKFQALKGMADILPGESEKWQELESKARHFFEAFGFEEIRTPLVELSELFLHTVGEGSDIVHKQMYTFVDRGGRSLTLRPEMTASVVRAAIENGILRKEKTTRLYYFGPMFRAERPQRGRQRQFHQMGAEILGARRVESDIEMVTLAHESLAFLGVEGCRLAVNHLGCEKDRNAYRSRLREYFSRNRPSLCEDCHYRMEKNVLRILDCKTESCQGILRDAPALALCTACDGDYSRIRMGLDEKRVPLREEKRLVRGLDYYTGLVFEITAAGELGSQDAVAAGGRYDGLISTLGGPSMEATGFAAGMERVLLARRASLEETMDGWVYVASLEQSADTEMVFRRILRVLYDAGKRVKRDSGLKSLGDHLKRADKLGIRHVLILGQDEVKTKSITVKDLRSKSQERIPEHRLAVYFAEKTEGGA